MRIIYAALACLVMASAAEARPGHGGGALPVTGPVLTNVSDNFGNRTILNFGGVRLSSQDKSYGTGYDPKGLDLVVSGGASIAKWTVTQTGGTAGHWNLPAAHTAEGTSAITPVPSSTGVTAQLNGGPYTFRIDAEDSSNNVLATATLTRTIVTDDGTGTNCGAVNIGDTDNVSVSYFPSGFASSLSGCAIYLSTGMSRTSNLNLGMPFTQPVTVTWSDPNRIGGLVGFSTGANSIHPIVKNFYNTGPSTSGMSFCFQLRSTTDVTASNIKCSYNQTIRDANPISFLGFGSPSGVITNCAGDWITGGWTHPSGWTINNCSIRHTNGDVINFESPVNCALNDITILSQEGTNVAVHPDGWQIKDGGTPTGCTMKRIMQVQAGGRLDTQTVFFGGGPTGVTGTFTGYIDDGTGAHGPGQTLTVVGAGGVQSNGNNSIIYSPSGSPVGMGDNVKVTCSSTPCPFGPGTQYTLTIPAGNINYASSGAPATFYGYQSDVNWDMVFSSGFLVRGVSYAASGGTSSFKHFAQVQETPAVHQPCGGGCGTPSFFWGNTAVSQVYTGTLAIGPGMNQSGFSGSAPANATVTNVVNAANNATTLASYYANGNPQTALEAITPSQWDAMSVDQVKAKVCQIMTPKVGGALDLGGGDWANPFNASGQWVDGTTVPGC